MRPLLLAITLASFALPLEAQRLVGTHLVIPVAGEIPSTHSGQYETDLQLTNFSQERLRVALRLVPTGVGRSELPTTSITLEPMEMRFIANVTNLFTDQKTLGAIVATASRPIAGAAFIRHRNSDGWSDEERRAMYDAIPASYAIRRGQTAQLEGVRPRYNVFVTETHGGHVELLFELTDSSRRILRSERHALPPHAHVVVNTAALLHGLEGREATIRCTVTNGNGRVIIAGAHSTAENTVTLPYRMSLDHARRGIPRNERIAYASLLGFAAVCVAVTLRARKGRF